MTCPRSVLVSRWIVIAAAATPAGRRRRSRLRGIPQVDAAVATLADQRECAEVAIVPHPQLMKRGEADRVALIFPARIRHEDLVVGDAVGIAGLLHADDQREVAAGSAGLVGDDDRMALRERGPQVVVLDLRAT